jgi:hypothetical protein
LNRITFEGLVSSCTQALNILTEKLQLAVLPDASVAVQVTVVVPTGTGEPDGGTQATLTPGQLSVATGGGKETTVAAAGGQAGAATEVTKAAQVMTGGCVSLTVTLKVHDTGLPFSSSAVQVTLVVPTGKNEPGVGEQVAFVLHTPVVVAAG